LVPFGGLSPFIGLSMDNIIKLQPKKSKTDFTNTSAYEIKKFTMTWEDTGLFYEGTIQINTMLKDIDNAYDSK